MNAQASLFDAPTTAGRVRANDAQTSYEASRAISQGVERAVWTAFRHYGPMHDDLLAERLNATIYGPTAKTARSRLSRRGVLVATSERGLSERGREQIVWALA